MIEELKTGKTEQEREEADQKVRQTVEDIIADVKARGDVAVRALSEKFDKWGPESYRLSTAQIEAVMTSVAPQTIEDIKFAQTQIGNFAQKQLESLHDVEVETLPGVVLGHKNLPVDSVGCYVPGGRYPMVASAHMSVLTAKVAGVRRVVACTPPINGKLPAETITAMHLAGADEIHILGGVQAVAAMAIGTETIAPVDMIVGPGNAFVAEAKRQLFGRVGIDMIAGPSEILVVADSDNDPGWIAADLLSQAEHDTEAQSILITDDAGFADAVARSLEDHLRNLPRADIARASWERHGAIIVLDTLDDAPLLIDRLAPEHLELAVDDPDRLAGRVRHAGAIFLGRFAPEAIGDYVAGPSHVLPTSRSARFSSGLGVVDFLKRTSLIGCDAESLARISGAAETLAREEGLDAHALSISLRREDERRN